MVRHDRAVHWAASRQRGVDDTLSLYPYDEYRAERERESESEREREGERDAKIAQRGADGAEIRQ